MNYDGGVRRVHGGVLRRQAPRAPGAGPPRTSRRSWRAWSTAVPPERIHVVTVPPPGRAARPAVGAVARDPRIDDTGFDLDVSYPNESLGAAAGRAAAPGQAPPLRTAARRADRHRWVRRYFGHEVLVPQGGARFAPAPSTRERAAALAPARRSGRSSAAATTWSATSPTSTGGVAGTGRRRTPTTSATRRDAGGRLPCHRADDPRHARDDPASATRGAPGPGGGRAPVRVAPTVGASRCGRHGAGDERLPRGDPRVPATRRRRRRDRGCPASSTRTAPTTSCSTASTCGRCSPRATPTSPPTDDPAAAGPRRCGVTWSAGPRSSSRDHAERASGRHHTARLPGRREPRRCGSPTATGNPLILDKYGRLTRPLSAEDADSLDELPRPGRRAPGDAARQGGRPGLHQLRHPARRGARRPADRPRQRRRPRLRERASPTPSTSSARRSASSGSCATPGWNVRRGSGSRVNVRLTPGDGSTRASSTSSPRTGSTAVLYMPSDTGFGLPREAILPLTTVELHGRPFPAPADYERLLAATYGPDWRVPDPVVQVRDPAVALPPAQRLVRRPAHQPQVLGRLLRRDRAGRCRPTPSAFARWVAGAYPSERPLVDLGAGNLRDARWFADEGRTDVLAVDYVTVARCGWDRKPGRR